MSNDFLSLVNLIYAALVWFIFIPLVLMVGKRAGLGLSFCVAAYVWHTFCCFVIISVVISSGGDEVAYYEAGLSGMTWTGRKVEFAFGTMFVNWLTWIILRIGDIGFVAVFMVFNFVGTLGIIIFGSCVKTLIDDGFLRNPILIWASSLLPGMSVWTASIGKDCFSILAISLFIKGTIVGRKDYRLIFLSILLMLLVRPHIAATLILSVLAFVFFQKRFSISSAFLFLFVLIFFMFIVLPSVLTMLGLSDLSLDAVSAYADKNGNQAFSRDDAAFWYSQAVPIRILMTAFYPTIMSAAGFFQFFVAIENMVLMLLFILFLWHSKFFVAIQKEDIHLLFLLLGLWIMLGSLMYNTGLAARQKWMFVPILVFLSLKYAGVSRVRVAGRPKYRRVPRRFNVR